MPLKSENGYKLLNLAHISLESGMVFKETTVPYERFNPKSLIKREKIICELEMDQYKKSHYSQSNLSNDYIKWYRLLESPNLVKSALGTRRLGLKTGVENDIFWSH